MKQFKEFENPLQTIYARELADIRVLNTHSRFISLLSNKFSRGLFNMTTIRPGRSWSGAAPGFRYQHGIAGCVVGSTVINPRGSIEELERRPNEDRGS